MPRGRGKFIGGRWVRTVPVLSPTTKLCKVCGEHKPLSEFSPHRQQKDKLHPYCKTCHASRMKRYRHAAGEPEWVKAKDRMLRRNFGIGWEQYQQIFEQQSGKCCICGQPEQTKRSATYRGENLQLLLAVDHDHVTGKVRGLLCGTCNRGIGYLRENPVFLAAAIIYLSGGRVIHAQQSESPRDELGEKRSLKGKGQRAKVA